MRPRFWSIQNMLLLLGAAMLAGASVVFLVFSWGQIELGPRALVIGALTVALFLSTWFVKHRGLNASAETISGLAALLLYLDAWALWATGLFPWGTESQYIATMTVVTGIILITLGLFMRMVTPRIIGTALVPLGAIALALGQSAGLPATIILTIGACGGLAMFHPRADRISAIALTISSALLLATTPITFVQAWSNEGLGAGAISLTSIALTFWLFGHFSHQLRRVLAVVTATTLTGSGLFYGAWALSWRGVNDGLPTIDTVALPIFGAVLMIFTIHGIVGRNRQTQRRGLHPIAVRTAVIVTTLFVTPIVCLIGLLVPLERWLSDAPEVPRTVHLIGAILVFGIGTFVLHLCRIDRPLTQHLSVWAAVAFLTALPLTIEKPLITFTLWLSFSIGAAVILAAIKPRGITRLPLQALVWFVLLAALMRGQRSSLRQLDGAGVESTNADIFGVFCLALAVVFFTMRSWDRRRHVPITAVPSQFVALLPVPSGNAPMPRPFAGGPGCPAGTENRYQPFQPGARAALLAVSALMAYLGLTAIIHGVLAPPLAAFLLVALPFLSLSVGLLLYRVRSQRAVTNDIKGVLTTSVAIGVSLLPTLVFNPQALVGVWLKVLAVTVALLILVLCALCVFSARARHAEHDNTRSLLAGLVPVSTLLLVRTCTTFDSSALIQWPLIALGALATVPTFGGLLLNRVASRRRALEYTTLIALIVVTLTLLSETRTLGFAFLILAAGAFLLATTPDRLSSVWFGYGLAIVSSWTLAASYGLGFVEIYTVPFAFLVCALGSNELRRGRSHLVLILGLAVLTIPSILQSWQEPSWRNWAIVALSGLIALALVIVRASIVNSSLRAPLTRDVAMLNVTVIILGPLTYATRLSQQGDVPQTLLWTVLPAFLIVLTCLAASLFGQPARAHRLKIWGSVLVSAVLTVPLSGLMVSEALHGKTATASAVLLIVLWGVLAFVGTPPGWPTVRNTQEFRTRTVPPLIITLILGVLLSPKVSLPRDALLSIGGIFVALVGVRAGVLLPHSSTWSNVGFGVIATIAPLSFVMLGQPTGWRVALAVLIASAWLLTGVRMQWQAPVILGGLALATQVLVLVGPPALAAFSGLQGWLVLAIVGAVLLASGLLYERQATTAKTAIKRLSDLR